MRAACAADVQKFCANIERAKGAMRACLEAHETQLSDGLQGGQGRARRRQSQRQELIRWTEVSQAGAGSTRPGLFAFWLENWPCKRNAAKVGPLRN